MHLCIRDSEAKKSTKASKELTAEAKENSTASKSIRNNSAHNEQENIRRNQVRQKQSERQ